MNSGPETLDSKAMWLCHTRDPEPLVWQMKEPVKSISFWDLAGGKDAPLDAPKMARLLAVGGPGHSAETERGKMSRHICLFLRESDGG